MEYHKNSKIIGIGKNVLIKFHGFLLVAPEIIDLYSRYSYVFKPFHLAAANIPFVHEISRSFVGIVYVSVGTIPENKANSFGHGVTAKLGHALTPNLLIAFPVGVNKIILIAHGCSHIYE